MGIENVPLPPIPNGPITGETLRGILRQIQLDMLRHADVRNAVGVGVTISADGNSSPTIEAASNSASVLTATAAPDLPSSRRLVGSTSVQFADGGPGGTFTASVPANGLAYDRLAQAGAFSVLGNGASSTGNVAAITAAADGRYLGRAAGAVSFKTIEDADLPATMARTSTGTFTATLTGCTATITGTAHWAKAGSLVTLQLPFLAGTSNANTCTVTGLPAAIQPARIQEYIALLVRDNSTYMIGLASISTGGVITLYPGANLSATSWTAANAKGLEGVVISYHVS